ncbi:helix-hairpin-helix domain-containing protein [Staphylococcus gallinarum]|uniref:DNA-binding protein n=1 Tax=Staphylococcus gallinarum TaxID=1293 RepID=A0A2T4T0R9_STAGA|nr:helix-hairpin-helix domain-containing protein [Staphylococcus gallinarum]MCD8821399.1 DNA-binding protein [Staphylococcus gallinarum]MCD8826918.1 DNA-binding protein [Staphylococcus gallinarum]MEB6243127.1 helix-hairpin-helix domain-containing protein [Staphylococcus gallinarum]MEB6296200.1 helix-hairpin-helix domain-containing protein [Staphylococcus gallinarum]PTE79554.1 DNA-binding protein [Staphylococcus gallinarum]
MGVDLPKVGKPATNALKAQGISSLEDVARYDKTTLLDIHGVGPKAIDILEKALAEHGLDFKNILGHELPFELIGDLKCDNAPKQRIMLDFLIASALVNKEQLIAVLSEDFIWKVPGAFELKGLDAFYDELSEHQVDIKQIVINDNISHGKVGSMHGEQLQSDGSKLWFADFFEFESHKKNAKIKTVTSYVIMDEGES